MFISKTEKIKKCSYLHLLFLLNTFNKTKFYFQSLVWQGFAELLHKEPNELAVVFKNVEFLRKTVIPENGKEIKNEKFWTIQRTNNF